MSFILSAQRDADDLAALKRNWENYIRSLEDARGFIPASAYEIAISDWWYEHDRPEAPHDSWLQKLELGEAKDEGGARYVTIGSNWHPPITGPSRCSTPGCMPIPW